MIDVVFDVVTWVVSFALEHPKAAAAAIVLLIGTWTVRSQVAAVATRDTAMTVRILSVVAVAAGGFAAGRWFGATYGTPQQIAQNLLAMVPV
ncbi:hypothetical protein [Halarchaeum sp. P4]|uniref:hypothetical protein n=1 Tax=Halarchaeum sp. P4 TaxID=3421639 RepID=UPI003EBEE593